MYYPILNKILTFSKLFRITSRCANTYLHAMAEEHALEWSVEDLADSPSCISVSARRRSPRYQSDHLATICQRSTGRVPVLSNIYRTLLPSCVYCGELSPQSVRVRMYAPNRMKHWGIVNFFLAIDSNLLFFERVALPNLNYIFRFLIYLIEIVRYETFWNWILSLTYDRISQPNWTLVSLY